MINKYLHILICLIILLLGMSFVPPAAAINNPPAIPNVFYGTVKINGENAPAGIEIQAYVGSILAGSALVEGEGKYKLGVRGAPSDEEKPITFMVGSLTAAETQVYYHKTSSRKLDLTILDNNAPVTTDNAPDGWQNSSFTVTLNATDNLGDLFVNATFYKVDDGAFVIGNSVEITEDGNHSITYYSRDYAGNIEVEKIFQGKLDTKAPVTSVEAPESSQLSPFWVNFTAVDEAPGSGINNTFYRFEDDTDPVCGNSLYIDKDGNYTIIYYSDDGAGNLEVEKMVCVELDTVSPVLEKLVAVPLSILNDSVDTSKISVNVTDLFGIGIANVTIDLTPIEGATAVEMSTSDGTLYTYEIRTNKTGEFEFPVTVTNNAGKSDSNTVSITVKTEESFIADYSSEDGVTQEDIKNVIAEYEDSKLSDSAAAKVVGKAYNVTYEEALSLLGIGS